MQFIENIAGAGSNKRIVYLRGTNDSGSAPIDYICAQVLDFMHDAKIDGASSAHVNLIVGMIVHWICALNQLDLATKARLCDIVTARIMILNARATDARSQGVVGRELHIVDVKRAIANITREYGASSTSTSTNSTSSTTDTPLSSVSMARTIVDSCGAQGRTRVIECDTSRAILTWSVMYDGGASDAYCKDARGRCIGLEPMEGLRATARAIDMPPRIMDRLSIFSLSLCANHRDSRELATTSYDMAIVANLRDLIGYDSTCASINRLIVLATRGCGLVAPDAVGANMSVSREQSIGFFAMQSFPGETVIIARSPPANETERIIARIIARIRAHSREHGPIRAFDVVTPQNEREMMYAYCILVAKHWGDLGLVIDARVRDAIIFTSDGVVCACCAILGITSILDGAQIIRASDASARCAHSREDNSGTIFGRDAVSY